VADVGTPFDDAQWSALLKSVSGFEMYRKKYGPHRSPTASSSFCCSTANSPRAVRYSIGRADQALHAITGTPAAASPAPRNNASACCGRNWTLPAWKPSSKAACTSFSTRCKRK